MSTEPVDVARAVIEAYNAHDMSRYLSLHTAACRITFADAAGSASMDDWQATVADMFAAIPDLRVAPVTIVGDDRTVMLELIQSGTYVSDHDDGGSPDRQRFEAQGVLVLSIADGRVTGERHHWPRSWLDDPRLAAALTSASA
jgi:hypothetical protein